MIKHVQIQVQEQYMDYCGNMTKQETKIKQNGNTRNRKNTELTVARVVGGMNKR